MVQRRDAAGPGGRTPHLRITGVLLLALLVSVPLLIVGLQDAAGAHQATTVLTNWTTYHADAIENGIAPSTTTFQHATHDWTSPALDGQLYGEPLVDGSLVVAATETDTVYALNASTGAVAWSTTVGTPVPAGALPCGDISPDVGITSTPVIDAARSGGPEVFVVADEDNAPGYPGITHHLVGLALATGHVLLDEVVDPPGTTPAAQLQRPGLALDDGSVLVAFGGNAGDCSTYHGWVVSVPEGGGTLRTWEADASAGNDQGAIWMGGAAPVVDGNGDIWVSTGNGSNTTGSSPDGSDSVLELSPSLQLVQSFTPSTWQRDNADDLDLGSSAPVVLPTGYVLQIGKSQTAYVLRASHLGGVGGQVSQRTSVCGSNVDGGSAFTSRTEYVPCLNGVMAVRISARHTLRVLWKTSTGSSGPPIVAGDLVWTVSRSGTLYGLRESNGRPAVSLSVGAPATHFPTPSVGAGLLLAPASDQVVAFH
ncbi:MAG: PQQ-binding-like beta-propeller repeat protein [Acidimicrobiales bacterium]|jgi:outer membrane protein assembly factor BamB